MIHLFILFEIKIYLIQKKKIITYIIKNLYQQLLKVTTLFKLVNGRRRNICLSRNRGIFPTAAQ